MAESNCEIGGSIHPLCAPPPNYNGLVLLGTTNGSIIIFPYGALDILVFKNACLFSFLATIVLYLDNFFKYSQTRFRRCQQQTQKYLLKNQLTLFFACFLII